MQSLHPPFDTVLLYNDILLSLCLHVNTHITINDNISICTGFPDKAAVKNNINTGKFHLTTNKRDSKVTNMNINIL